MSREVNSVVAVAAQIARQRKDIEARPETKFGGMEYRSAVLVLHKR